MIENKGEVAKEKREVKGNFRIITHILQHRFLTFSNLRATSNLNDTAAYLQI